ncbi:hypothetical protein OIU79_017217 [Salix purpurea]|uniref:Uncharacterized protein n=1 Tax=Salix purpurea TaxID=77065 RepID=A0A9Q0WUG3_SALPP|nr:hypothetical protein OIU79_017217 [Salix purpurea]
MEPHCPPSPGMLIFLLLFQMKKHVLELDSNKELSYDEQDEAYIGELLEFMQRMVFWMRYCRRYVEESLSRAGGGRRDLDDSFPIRNLVKAVDLNTEKRKYQILSLKW